MKHVVLLNARPGMARDAFIRRYEDGHVPLVCEVLPFFSDYRRNYTIPSPDGRSADAGCDVITELWYDSAEAIDRVLRTHDETDAGPRIDADEMAFLDRSRMTMMVADECRTPAALLAQRPAGHRGLPAVKLFQTMKRRPDVTPAAFRDHHEDMHGPALLDRLRQAGAPVPASHARSYPGDCFGIGERSGPLPPPFDVLTEFGFWTEADWRAFERIGAGAAAIRPGEEAARFADPETIRWFRVEQYVTPAARPPA